MPLLVLGFLILAGALTAFAAPITIQSADISFARSQDGQAMVLGELDSVIKADGPRTINLLMYSLTDTKIAQRLIDAAKAGVTVQIVMDASEAGERGSQYQNLSTALGANVVLCTGLPEENGRFGIMHEKLAILNGAVVMIGSYNWTGAAHRSNWEDLLIVNSPDMAAACQAEFDLVWKYAAAHPTGPLSYAHSF